MPRYYFHVINGHFVTDQAGTECPTIQDVKAEAVLPLGLQMLSRKYRGKVPRVADMAPIR